jgi:GT2 family glycosyltransferase
MKIGFVCTNYNNSSYTRAAIASLHASGRWSDVRAVIVDNASRDEDVESLRELAREFPGVELVLNPENVGYFPGLNVGMKHLRSRFPDVEHLVVGNNDLVFPPNFVDVVERYREVFERWAVVAPDLVTPAGVHQNPHVLHPISRARQLVWNLYFLSYGLAAMIKYAARVTRRFTVRPENAPDSELHRTPGPIEQGYGACYLLGPMFFRHFSQLSAPTFLMQEEYFLFEQLKTIGQMTYYDPRFVVHHQGHATMDRLPSRRHWTISRESHRTYNRYRAMSPDEQLSFIMAGSREAR